MTELTDMPITSKEERTLLRDEVTAKLEQAEAALLVLVDSYTEENDGKFSACHSRQCFASSLNQIQKLRKSIKGARV